ncbi:putative enzyme related to lactoylglutathione lyase [Curtobacterium sp. PhB130]|uniref:VOC family protein n=1 Tax=unclassified Curtobacterium TaxID=257496 RepID=UPI000F4C26B3|nr:MULTISPECIES: VOC family protein [unclassified Curtobacterium]ROP63299.1 putative enzyme related to lactoylglutathione lyase [Curtobacterium sp. ZW137]ROS77563.1 putative enzyme related to lactoylglutathione lyase [Curtobacterium sp. PhB130]TCK66230.1 putative enzyme related to lactoylglutathione lyase [Curtobacterium sp. PhB136]
MEITSVTVGLPVTDLEASCLWYGAVFERVDPDLEPAEGVAEYEIGGIWIQLVEDPDAEENSAVVRFGVDDVAAQHTRIAALGIDVGPVERVEGAIDWFDVHDPDGNVLSLYSLADETGHGSDGRDSGAGRAL